MLIIDRFEGDLAVVENDDDMVDIPREMLPEDAEEGDVIVETDGGYIVDAEATEQRREAAAARLRRLMGK